MSFTEIVVRAGHTNAESANLLVSIRLVDLVGSQRVYYCFDRHYSVSQLSQGSVLFAVCDSNTEYPELGGISHVPSVRSLSLPVEKVITS